MYSNFVKKRRQFDRRCYLPVKKIMVYVFFADGFEEIEAIAPVDILRRSNIAVKTVGVGGRSIRGAHGITIAADIDVDSVGQDSEMIVLPGGMPGTRNLEKSAAVQKCIDYVAERGAFIAAICAAPSILGHKGLLRGKKAVCYPGYEKDLVGASVMSSQVCEDGQIITGNGPGAAFAFGLLLASRLGGDVGTVKSGMLIN
jgi:protein deglycase